MNNDKTDRNPTINSDNNEAAGVPKKNGSGGGNRQNRGRGGCSNPRQTGKGKSK